jgi:shikimate dehydrogenase
MTDRYAVFGNPVAHSRSPAIHAEFARSTGQDIRYDRILAPLDGFAAAVDAFRREGGRGANVTLPFKREAWQLATVRSARADAAEAVNTLRFDADGSVFGDNTDGVGLVRDIELHLGQPLAGARVLMLGAGGAAAGVLQPLLASGIARLHVANRTADRALALVERQHGSRGSPVEGDPPAVRPAAAGAAVSLTASALDAVEGEFDLVINATSASLGDHAPSTGQATLAPGALCYDMMYAAEPSAFLCAARARGARIADGIGMLVEQAAESFLIWRGVRPDTRALLAGLAQPWRGAR